MKKIIVIGCPGSGKSTFSTKLREILNIQIYHLDMIYWKADKSTISKEELIIKLDEIMKETEWIIDGNYGSTIEFRLQKCDTVFFLDFDIEICLNGIDSRKGKERKDMPWIEETNKQDEKFIEFVKNYNKDSKPKIMKLLEKYNNKDIYFFKNRNESTQFVNELKENMKKGHI